MSATLLSLLLVIVSCLCVVNTESLTSHSIRQRAVSELNIVDALETLGLFANSSSNFANGTFPSVEDIVITEAAKSFSAGVSFYWGTRFLPVVGPKEGVMNCSRSVSTLKDHRFALLRFADGRRPTEMAWQCGAGSFCCSWECCQPAFTTEMVVGTVLVVLLAVSVFAFCACLLRN